MSPTAALRLAPLAADADALNFCATCAFSSACLDQGYDKTRLNELHILVDHVGPLAEGTHLFREGDPFEAIAAVRTGTVKTYVVDREGRETVLGFHLPGELIGLSAISRDRYPCNAVALEPVALCRFSFPEIATLATRIPGIQQRLFQLLSEDIGKASLLLGDFTAEERLAAFLALLVRRYRRRGLSGNRFSLPMARTDIANYLRLAPETVSRLLRRFQDLGFVSVERRFIEISDEKGLLSLAVHVLRN